MEQDTNKPLSLAGANRVYLISMLLLLTIGAYVQDKDFEYGIVITEFLLIALPSMIFVKLSGKSIIKVFRFNRLKVLDVLLIFLIFLSSYFVAIFLNMIGSILLSMWGDLIPPPIPFAKNVNQYFVLLLVIAGTAGICEEILMRGLMLRAYEGLGMWKSIAVTAVLFSLLHLNVENIIAPAFLGILLGYVVYKTNSIFASMLGHFTFNAVSVTLSFVISSLPMYQSMTDEALATGVETPALLAAALVFGVIAVFAGTFMAACLMVLKERFKHQDEPMAEVGIRSVLGKFRISWPLYISFVIFLGMTCIELYYMRTGQSIMNMLK